MTSGPEGLLRLFVGMFDRIGIPYMVVGSFASTAHGEPRSTQDLDIVIDPTLEQLNELLCGLDVDARAHPDPVRVGAETFHRLLEQIQPDTGHDRHATIADLHADSGETAKSDDREILFEPDAQTVLESLLPLYVNREVYQHVLDAKASEHSSRMVAMKTAKDNATKLVGDLTLEYNKARQAGITQEILEIAAASFSVQ